MPSLAARILQTDRQPVESWEPSRQSTAGIWELNQEERDKHGGRFIVIYLRGHNITSYAIF